MQQRRFERPQQGISAPICEIQLVDHGHDFSEASKFRAATADHGVVFESADLPDETFDQSVVDALAEPAIRTDLIAVLEAYMSHQLAIEREPAFVERGGRQLLVSRPRAYSAADGPGVSGASEGPKFQTSPPPA